MRQVFILVCLIILLAGCVTTSSITSKLSLGMTKEQVLQVCGRPYRTGAMIEPQTGDTIETLTYESYRNGRSGAVATILLADGNPNIAFINVYLKNGKVVQYNSVEKPYQKPEKKVEVKTNNNESYVVKDMGGMPLIKIEKENK